MGIASWARFIVGLLLSIEIIREVIVNESISSYAIILSVAFIGLSIMFVLQKFILNI